MSLLIERLWRYEFWPAYIFYLPLLPYLLYQTLRSGGFGVIATANPAIPGGGIVGESKYQILSLIPAPWALRTYLLREDQNREQQLEAILLSETIAFPLIMKPDASQRGASVRILHSREQMYTYLEQTPGSVLVQDYHAGPEEVGIFYVRDPDQPTGALFSITGKTFPSVSGDGKSTLRSLIEKHPRYRFQKRVFFERFRDLLDTVPSAGQHFSLGRVGNHCQGTLFYDRSDLITPALTERIDAISKQMGGFYFGRFDIRFASVEELRKGENFRIVEANGITSESTNLYDPGFSLIKAYSILFKQWNTLFSIGRTNRDRCAGTPSLLQIFREACTYYRDRSFPLQSD